MSTDRKTTTPTENDGASTESLQDEIQESAAAREPAADPTADGDERVEEAERRAAEAHDRLLRVSADLENFKKRTAREMEDFRRYANEALIKDLLPVIDNLERAMASCDRQDPEVAPFLEGVEMTHGEILKVLERFAVRPIRAEGEPFDPAYHQAVFQEASDQHPENTVVSEFQKGYLMHDRLLRPAMVVVSKGKDAEREEEPRAKNTENNAE